MHFILILIVVLLVIFGPQLWAQYTFKRYSKPLDRIPGNGAQLARHLLQRFEVLDVQVEQTDQGDHYDPEAKCVRLSPHNYNDHSLTAIAVAAHEVGHAIQHHRQEAKLTARTRLVKIASQSQKIGVMVMIAIPFVTLFSRSPAVGLITLLLGFASMGISTLVHLVTLPVEIDASFGKALPMLKQGNYIEAGDEKAVTRILRAAAYTYVAASLAGLLNLWRWAGMLRR